MNARGPGARGAAGRAPAHDDELRSLLRRVCEVPAPTFAEEARATLVARLLREATLEVRRDAAGNVLAWLPGGAGPRVALAAHLDTVFAADVPVEVRTEGDRWLAPGIGDDAAGVAVLLHLARELARGGASARPRLLLAFTVGEEGEGDLRGAREVVRAHRDELDVFVAVDGHLGSVVDTGVGSRRYRATFTGPGGHAWGDYPAPSAVHAAGDAVHALTRIHVPEAPRSSLNVGQLGGGTAVNAIAERAWLTLDLRSVDAAGLDVLTEEAERRLRSVARRHRVQLSLARIGDRPPGRSDDGTLRDAARAALRSLDLEPSVGASSTDANAAMAEGLPAVCIGVYRGGDAHRLGEWLDPASLDQGAAMLRAFLAELAARWRA
ncbi:MAG: M20/M25/M40 family metallo-hydrolase [Trueperaceae bacterium]|nr:M20/M25/M40 family metallo-hydrolase [Trueperaceae bacterium]